VEPQHFIDAHKAWLGVLLPLCFVGFWCLITGLVSFLGGWHTLSERFVATTPFPGITEGLQSGQMRWGVNYRGCLRLGANQEGLSLSVLFLFRFMHPPLFIPWHEIRVSRRKRLLFGDYVTLSIEREQEIPLRIAGATAQMLSDSAGTAWPVEEV